MKNRCSISFVGIADVKPQCLMLTGKQTTAQDAEGVREKICPNCKMLMKWVAKWVLIKSCRIRYK